MDYLKRAEVERDEEWREKWVEKIPHLQFKEDWKIKIIPPFGGAIARFWIDKEGNHVSVYLDCYENLGYFGEPYWEVYPYKDDVYRVAMNDTDELLKIIAEVIDI
jgi:hypothetical protein